MDNQNKTIVIRPIVQVTEMEQSEKFPGKWIAKLRFHPDTPAHKYWLSDKQKRGLERAQNGKEVFCAIDATEISKERFIWASDNVEWLTKAFVKPAAQDEVF